MADPKNDPEMTDHQKLLAGFPVRYLSLNGGVELEATYGLQADLGLNVLVIKQQVGERWKKIKSQAMTEIEIGNFANNLKIDVEKPVDRSWHLHNAQRDPAAEKDATSIGGPVIDRGWPNGSLKDLDWSVEGVDISCDVHGEKYHVARMMDEETARHVVMLHSGSESDRSREDTSEWFKMHDDHIASINQDDKMTYFGSSGLEKDADYISALHNAWLEATPEEPGL
jgi:hypothetical protein